MAGAYRLYLVLKSIQPFEAAYFSDRLCNCNTAFNHFPRYFVGFALYLSPASTPVGFIDSEWLNIKSR